MFWVFGEVNMEFYNEYEICIVMKFIGDLGDWREDDCYKFKGYICKIEGEF